MKRLALLAIPILAVTFAAGGITANAAENGIEYPEDDKFTRNLTFSSLTDYAVEGNLYVFADGKSVKVYNDGIYTEYLFESDVTAVGINKDTKNDEGDKKDNENDKKKDDAIYCSTADKAYKANILNGQPESHFKECQDDDKYEFGKKVNRFVDNDITYTYSSINGKLYISCLLTPEADDVTYDGEYFNFKQFGDNVYAICDNVLHEFTGTVDKPLDELKYTVSASDVEIKIGNSKDKLKSFSGVQFVDIAKDTYLTEINLEQLKGENFVALDIVKTDKVTTALLLCESGNGAIVSIHEKAYAVLNEKIESRTTIDTAIEKPREAQVSGTDVYASPFTSSGTSAKANASGLIVTVIGIVENSILERVFYEVEYEENGETVKGYVALLDFLVIEDNGPPKNIPDSNYSDKTDTKTILIVLAVVFLVLAAILYISHVTAKGKKKKTESDEKK